MPAYTREVKVPGKSSQELYEKVSQGIDRFMEKASVGSYELERDEARKRVTIKSSMLTGTLSCKDGALVLDAKLSLLAMPFKSKLDEGIDRWVAKTFSPG